MNNIRNHITGIKHTSIAFDALKEHLSSKAPDPESLVELIALLEHRKDKLGVAQLTIAALEDGITSDNIIHALCNSLMSLSPPAWLEIKEALNRVLTPGYISLSRQQLLYLAETIEILYARRVDGACELARMIFDNIPLTRNVTSMFSEENLHIQLARIAYGCNKYNVGNSLLQIDAIKHSLSMNNFKHHYKGMLHYYRALCVKELEFFDEEQSPSALINKSACTGFELAHVYQRNHIETSKF